MKVSYSSVMITIIGAEDHIGPHAIKRDFNRQNTKADH